VRRSRRDWSGRRLPSGQQVGLKLNQDGSEATIDARSLPTHIVERILRIAALPADVAEQLLHSVAAVESLRRLPRPPTRRAMNSPATTTDRR
jgi:hypothetical protein